MNRPSIVPLHIAGAGPAGLAAAISAARRGSPVTVHERQSDVGHRFHGDFQGLENWTTDHDVLEDLAVAGIEPTFDHVPFSELTVFDHQGRAHQIRSAQPMWYLIRRGNDAGTLDVALKRQADAQGVTLSRDDIVRQFPAGGIVAHGPRRPDVIAVGYVFDTALDDAAFAVASDDLAPKGYAYLLIAGGRATMASCMFEDFHNERIYLERTASFFRRTLGVEPTSPRRFGGFGNVYGQPAPHRGNMLYVGEAAGFQDPLFGFGIRYALTSGQLAANAWLDGQPQAYAERCAAAFDRQLMIGATNRYLYGLMGNAGYARLLRHIDGQPDAREWLRRYYTTGTLRRWFGPVARRRLKSAPAALHPPEESCDCTWCQCTRHQAPAEV